jgi:hypothetical protein
MSIVNDHFIGQHFTMLDSFYTMSDSFYTMSDCFYTMSDCFYTMSDSFYTMSDSFYTMSDTDGRRSVVRYVSFYKPVFRWDTLWYSDVCLSVDAVVSGL